MTDCVLVTGFEPYGQRGLNPSAEIAGRLNGRKVEGHEVTSAVFPVQFQGLRERMEAAIESIGPRLVLCLGLWPGEPVIRVERSAINRADFEIPDNDGEQLRERPLDPDGPHGYPATLPTARIVRALRENGLPARPSDTAGTFLCNATLYFALNAAKARSPEPLAGFIHLPYLPEQVAGMLDEISSAGTLELHQRADLASMSSDDAERAIEIALRTALAERDG